MARQRDYRAEYQRRIAGGLARGLTRSQARGHARSSEPPASLRVIPRWDRALEEGIKEMRKGERFSKVAKALHIAPERLRRYALGTGVVEKRSGKWTVVEDLRPRQTLIYSRGRAYEIVVPGYEPAASVGHYLNDVEQFRLSNNPAFLAPYVGRSVTDVHGTVHVFETRPNVLYRLVPNPEQYVPQVYRILAV